MNRRQLMKTVPAAVAGISMKPAMGQSPKNSPKEGVLPLEQYEPKSMLHTVETHVPRARFPLIDFHTHLTWSGELSGKDEVKLIEKPEELLPVMDRKNIHTMVDLTGGYANGLNDAIRLLQQAHPGRFIVFTEPWWSKIEDPNYPKFQADQIEAAHKAGAKGIKVLKILGLYLREHVKTGKLVAIDDRRFDPMWEACAALNMPVFMHVSDPEAFFLPTDASNERYEELACHPDWSFYGPAFPGNAELLAARDRVIARHPNTTFALMHVGNGAENLAAVADCLERFPNTVVDISARIGELGRQPRTARRFFERFQDRILFGTDAVPPPYGDDVPQQLFGDALYEIYYRFLETDDEYFDYAPAETPPQGRWSIYGLDLPDAILRKVYHDNAARLLGLP